MTVIILGLHRITPVSMLVDKGQNFLENTKPVLNGLWIPN